MFASGVVYCLRQQEAVPLQICEAAFDTRFLSLQMAQAKPYPRIPSAGKRHIRRGAAGKRGRIQSMMPGESLKEQQVEKIYVRSLFVLRVYLCMVYSPRLQMKLREEREEKRSTMDGRHEYVLSTVADRLSMTMEDAEEFMLDGDEVSAITLPGDELSDLTCDPRSPLSLSLPS